MFATECAANKIKDEACYEHVKSCENDVLAIFSHFLQSKEG